MERLYQFRREFSKPEQLYPGLGRRYPIEKIFWSYFFILAEKIYKKSLFFSKTEKILFRYLYFFKNWENISKLFSQNYILKKYEKYSRLFFQKINHLWIKYNVTERCPSSLLVQISAEHMFLYRSLKDLTYIVSI